MTTSGAVTVALPSDEALASGALLGPYRVERRLGEGGMGVVLLATHRLLGRPAALKVIRPELAADRDLIERFLREARAAAAVNHQHLVAILDAGEAAGRTWLAFEYVGGGDLDAVLAKEGPLDAARALALCAQCADGLQALHEAGLVHRDIKPHNIFLDARGRPKLGDFGLARRASGDDRLTMTGTGMGTPAYMAPEQANGDPALDIRADIHALGGTLYTLLTRRTPFAGATPWAVVNAVLTEPPPDPRAVRPDLPAECGAIIARAMAKRREDRFATPAELAAACRAAAARLAGTPAAAAPLTVPPAGGLLGPFAGRGWLWLLAAAALLLVLPLALNPLCALDAGWRGPGYDQPGLWGRWLGFTALAAALLWQPLRQAHGERGGRAGGLATTLLCAGLGGTLLWCAAAAALVAAGAGSGWQGMPMVLAVLAAIAWLAWWSPRAWHREPTALAGQFTRLAQFAIPLVVAAAAGHLLAAGRSEPGLWAGRFAGRTAEAAEALALALPLAATLIVPLLCLRRTTP